MIMLHAVPHQKYKHTKFEILCNRTFRNAKYLNVVKILCTKNTVMYKKKAL